MDFVKGLERFQALGLTCNCRYGPLWRRTTIHCPWRPHSQSAPYRRYLGDPDYSGVTDGIIVGSAIIKLIEAHTIKQGNDLKAGPGLVKKVGEFIGEMKKLQKRDIDKIYFKLIAIDADNEILLKPETPFQETMFGRNLKKR